MIVGPVPIVSDSPQAPNAVEAQPVEYPPNPVSIDPESILALPEKTKYGTYSYNITNKFSLLPKSIKTLPFLSFPILFNYTLEQTIYFSYGSNSGLFQRIFNLRFSEFLPAGIITFYLATGLTLGQGRLRDASQEIEQKISLGHDPNVRFVITHSIMATLSAPQNGPEIDGNVIIFNRNGNQPVSVRLNMYAYNQNTILIIKNRSSFNITMSQSSTDKSIIIIHAMIQPNRYESCNFSLQQFF